LGWRGTGDAGVGEEHVEMAVFGLDPVGDFGEGRLAGYVADNGDDVGIGALGGCCLERGFAAA